MDHTPDPAATRLTLPTVHLNGTSRQDLVDGYRHAYVAVGDAIRALARGAAPNARDYYVQGPDAYARAAREAASRVARLAAVQQELLALCDAVDV
jgi:hypothetical protein